MLAETIFLIRHATPDWSRTDLPYHLPPGPPLTPQGEAEARELGLFLAEAGIAAVYASPLERCLRTAQIAVEGIGLTPELHEGLAEIRPGEKEGDIHARLWPVWETAARAEATSGPVALVTHGGPIALLLTKLGLLPETLAHYKRTFDRNNPLPPAGVWQAVPNGDAWALKLAFTPEKYRAQLYV